MLPQYPYWRLLLLTLIAALVLSQFVYKFSLPNWWIHPTGIGVGLALYAILLFYKRSELIAFETGESMPSKDSGLGPRKRGRHDRRQPT